MQKVIPMRNAGLDVIRSSAIVLVLVCHGIGFFFPPHFDVLGTMYVTGYMGVELFFVLSGFLIGKIIVNDIAGNPRWSSLAEFYFRRWMRTLPLYYILFLLLCILSGKFPATGLVFVQNFTEEHLNVFPVSWSLSIEEWFYLLMPLAVLLSVKYVKWNKTALFFIVSALFVLIPTAYKFAVAAQHSPAWDFGVRKQIFLRLDSIAIGVIAAGIQCYCGSFYEKIAKSNLALAAGVCGLSYLGAYYVYTRIVDHAMDASLFGRTLLFPAVSLFIAILLIRTERSERLKRWMERTKTSGLVRYVSVTSYSVYLIHFTVYSYANAIANAERSLFGSFFLWIGSTTLVYCLAHVMYTYIESPILKWRDSLTRNRRAIAKEASTGA